MSFNLVPNLIMRVTWPDVRIHKNCETHNKGEGWLFLTSLLQVSNKSLTSLKDPSNKTLTSL